jgi:hypothetical protein
VKGDLLAQYLPAKAPEGAERTKLVKETVAALSTEKAAFVERQTAETAASSEASDYAISLIRKGDEVDHIVPIALHPEFGNEIGNLQLLPESENASKGASMDAAGIEHLRRLQQLPIVAGSKLAPPKAEVPLPESSGAQSAISDPATSPGWSLFGGTLLYQGKEVSANVDWDAARWKLSRERFIEERVWIEKERVFGTARRDEYARLREHRLTRATEQERRIVQEMLKTYLPSQ